MSVGAQLWRQIVSKTDSPRLERPGFIVHSVNDPAFSLVHQLFFPHGRPRRTSILLVAPDEISNIRGLSERIAVALSKTSGEMVGIIEPNLMKEQSAAPKKPASTSISRPDWQSCLTISERVRRIPYELLSCDKGESSDTGNGGLEPLRAEFDYFVIAASACSSDMPILCDLCDAAVLVLTANITRREAGIRAKQDLVRQGVNLLGVVLDQRTWPIPEYIYRRL